MNSEVNIERAIRDAPKAVPDFSDLHQRRDDARARVLALVDELAGRRDH